MKVIVAHPAQQHSYRLATALKRAGVLDKYATTVYFKNGSMTKAVSTVLKGKFRIKAESRHCDELEDKDVIQFCEGEGLLKLVALNTSVLKKHYYQIKYHTADRFAKKVAKYAIKHNADAVVTYDDSSPVLFEILKKEAPHIVRIMDMSSANLLYLKKIYESDMIKAPDFAARMKKERSICWDPTILDRAEREIKATQIFLTPSTFVERSLTFSGIKPAQMFRCPYGVDVSQFQQKEYHDVTGGKTLPIRFVYVGGVKELKGISYLLEAFMNIPKEQAELTVVGNFDSEDSDIKKYLGRVTFTGMVLHSEIPDILKKSDVFIFPSIGDSYALSVMEAASCGLPVIVSENTGVCDKITNGVEGFVVPIQSSEALIEKIHYFISNPHKIETMGKSARKMAEENSWNAYYDNITSVIDKWGGVLRAVTRK